MQWKWEGIERNAKSDAGNEIRGPGVAWRCLYYSRPGPRIVWAWCVHPVRKDW